MPDVAGGSLRGRGQSSIMEVEERRPGTRPSGMTGCGQRPRETERAPDPKEINVPARNEQRIGRVQRHGLLCWPAGRRPWPTRWLGSPPSAPTRCDGCHDLPQLRDNRGYSVPAASALPDPAEPRLGIRIRLPVLAVTPGSAGAFLVVLVAAGQADHASIVPYREGQAAFALRIRRRRSADRSSSFSPPQVPYFSGRLTA